MDSLPLHLVKEIIFRLDPKSLVMMQCADISIQLHIFNDPYFKSEYLSRVGSGLIHISSSGSHYITCHYFHSTTTRIEIPFQILGCCSGLLLLFVNGLCVLNPLTKSFRFLNHSQSKLKPEIVSYEDKYLDRTRYKHIWKQTNQTGFAVDQVDGTTQRFKIVCLIETSKALNPRRNYVSVRDQRGRFLLEIIRIYYYLSLKQHLDRYETCLRKRISSLVEKRRKYRSFQSRNRASTTARVIIPINFPQELSLKILFAATDNEVTLISARKEAIYVYALENMVTDYQWVLVRQIGKGVVDETGLKYWNAAAYHGKSLVMDEDRFKYWNVTAYYGKSLVVTDRTRYHGVFHEYDVIAKKWGVIGVANGWCDSDHDYDYYQFIPSLSNVIGLDDHEKMETTYDDDKRFSSLSTIMRVVNEISPFSRKLLDKKTLLRKRLIDIEEAHLIRVKIYQDASCEVGINKRRRVSISNSGNL